MLRLCFNSNVINVVDEKKKKKSKEVMLENVMNIRVTHKL